MLFNAAFLVLLAMLVFHVRNQQVFNSRTYVCADAAAQALAVTSLLMSGATAYFWMFP